MFAPGEGEEGWVGEMGNKHEYNFSFLKGRGVRVKANI